jgi:hypothetical protein
MRERYGPRSGLRPDYTFSIPKSVSSYSTVAMLTTRRRATPDRAGKVLAKVRDGMHDRRAMLSTPSSGLVQLGGDWQDDNHANDLDERQETICKSPDLPPSLALTNQIAAQSQVR